MKRFFKISTDGSTPTWTIVAAKPIDAWRLWIDHEDASGYLDGEALTDDSSFGMIEIDAAIVAAIIVDDDGDRHPLSDAAIGCVFCSEY